MDSRNWSHAKLLGIKKSQLKREAFGHPEARWDNGMIEARGEAYWLLRRAEDRKREQGGENR